MKEYIKIETVFQRDMAGTKRIMPGVFQNPAAEYLKDKNWIFTEKIDGTNIRVHWDGHAVEFGGRTDNAQIPAILINKLNELFGGPENEEVFEQLFGGKDVILFGEGYGSKIQKCGSEYIPNGVSFIMFDAQIDGTWLKYSSMQEIAAAFGVNSVPIILTGSIDAAVNFVKSHPKSTIGTAYMEGLVGKPAIDLFDRLGNRIIIKIKYRDF